ncbi:DUF1150 family protein [Oceanibacterium hippocampi]|uniref:DUF1150 domain-containing protein n=1 Tax=Oceanibacterium hippocampi TaxID=745714 RepID=A0A1Y5RR98_9PROT|nr:DUF1150 family protein [Oceanibacterium hippocampi]SLN23081.1 hypothetical protein OCH7691_00623 [Oceanibacterium hippocampi]
MNTGEMLRRITPAGLAALGLPHLAYVRREQGENGRVFHVLYSADGIRLLAAESHIAALAAAHENELQTVALH